MKKEIKNVLIMLLASVISAFGLHVFVYPSDFAPSGVDGLATILQEVTGVNAGIFNFSINLPLMIAAWFILKRRYVIYTVLYTSISSALIFLLSELNFYQYVTTTDKLLPAIFGGVAQGLTGLMLSIGASAGGVDVLACMTQKKMPHVDIEKLIAFFSYVVVGISFFVYQDLNCILLSIVEIFVCEKITTAILKDRRNAVKFEIVTTKEYETEIRRKIIYELGHGATVFNAQGMFTDEDKVMIFCVVSYRRIPAFLSLISKTPNVFLYYSDVMGVRGNFDWRKDEERPEDKKLREEKIAKESENELY
jgi:uncharacterized membrane-anchored protein YitT (DUF2179 family)